MEWRKRALGGLFAVLACCHGCKPPELCVPVDTRLGFFSRGNCVVANAVFFQGHEWITYFGNQDLPEEVRFPRRDLTAIAEANRRVDWPKELLVHMNTSVFRYLDEVTAYTERPEHQRFHFLLTDVNSSEEASADAIAHIRELTRKASYSWGRDRTAALAAVGQATHTIQDSFSAAHTVRDPDRDWCIVKVKAYMPRADGYNTPDIEYHGEKGEDRTGHITVEDSIYREGRSCHDPERPSEVEACLNGQAQRARLGTRDYLALIQRAAAALQTLSPDDYAQRLDKALDDFIALHLETCP